MTSRKSLTLTTHGLLELCAGLLLIAAGLTVDAGSLGIVVLFAAGALVAGVGLAALDALAPATHLAMDRWLAVAFAVGGVVAVAAGGAAAGVALLLMAAAQMGLISATRWTRPLR